jgi:hypothetical protein
MIMVAEMVMSIMAMIIIMITNVWEGIGLFVSAYTQLALVPNQVMAYCNYCYTHMSCLASIDEIEP